jgi:putative membrane protein
MFGLWAFFVSMTIYFLNKTVKPILFSLTLPITAMTLGIFYPFINVIILNIVDILYGSHFNINGIFMSFVVACLISILNVLTDQIIIQPLLRGDKHESDLI